MTEPPIDLVLWEDRLWIAIAVGGLIWLIGILWQAAQFLTDAICGKRKR